MIPRMRTAKHAVELIRETDPDTEVTERAIRRMLNAGEISCVPVGRKKLINVDALIQKLGAGTIHSVEVTGHRNV